MENAFTAQDLWSLPYYQFPFSLREEGESGDFYNHFQESSGLSVYEDIYHIYVDAYVPGISREEIEVSLENGALLIKAMKKQTKKDRKKKYYKRAASSFSYYVTLPLEVEQKLQQALCNGILRVVLLKKIRINAGKKERDNLFLLETFVEQAKQ